MNPEYPEVQAVALRVIEALDGLGLRYHLGGSWASSTHGIPRQTQDVDIVVALPEDLVADLVTALGGDFYADEKRILQAARSRSSANIIHLESGVKIDLFVAGADPFDREELDRSRAVELPSGHTLWVKSPEDTILRKLQCGGRSGVVRVSGA